MIKKMMILLLCATTLNIAQTIQSVALKDSSNLYTQRQKLFYDSREISNQSSLKYKSPIGSGDVKVIKYLALGGIIVGLLMIFAESESLKKTGSVVAGVSAIVYFLFGGD